MSRLKTLVNEALNTILAETNPGYQDSDCTYAPSPNISISRDNRGNIRISYRVNIHLWAGDNK